MKYFGTDGIRGIVNEDLTIELITKIGKAINVLNINRVYIGYDTRQSNHLVLSALISGLLSVGINVVNVGLVSTPFLQYYSKENKVVTIMITASHNPYFYNGIKIFKNGDKLSFEEEKLIEDNLDTIFPLKVGDYKEDCEAINNYINFLSKLKFKSKYNIALDLANGALIRIVKELFSEDDKVEVINNQSNGININHDCGSLHIKNINSETSDCLFSFDGDGDRLLFKFKNKIIDGDMIVYLLAKYYKEKKEKITKVVLTKNANLGIIKAFKRIKVKVLLSDVGDKNVHDLMIKENCILGGETSGHIINFKYMTSGDGLLNFLILNKILNEIDIDEYLKDIEYYPESNLNLSVNYSSEILKKIKDKYQRKARINVRKSGTEEVIRVNICTRKKETLYSIVKEIKGYE